MHLSKYTGRYCCKCCECAVTAMFFCANCEYQYSEEEFNDSLKSLFDESYQERLAICLANNVPQELAEEIANECAMRLIKGDE